jgi:hypothetical protein
MTDQRKNLLVENVKAAIKDSQIHVERTEGLFRAYQNASRSEEGDRAHAEASYNLARERHQKLLDFIKEVESNQVSFIETTDREFYFAKESIAIPGLMIIGIKSPLGQAILNKKAGDKYKLLGKEYQILSIS